MPSLLHAADAGVDRTALREIKLLQEVSHPNIIGVSTLCVHVGAWVGVWEAGAGERWVCPMYSVCIVAAQSLTEVLTTSCSGLLTRTNALTGFTIANAKYFIPLDPV